MAKDAIYTDSEVTINGVTYRNLPAQVRRNQSLAEQASEDATGAVQGITEAKAAADAAQTAANNAQTAADAAQTTATNAGNTANTALEQAQTAETLARGAQEEAADATDVAAKAMEAATGTVKYNAAQSLTDAQKQQARDNIGVTESGATVDAALSLTSENPVQNKVITASLQNKLDVFQGSPEAGKAMIVNLEGYLLPTDIPAPAEPDDYVIDHGIALNWIYRKWNSGILEQWRTASTTIGKWNTWGGKLYESGNYLQLAFGINFIGSPPTVIASIFGAELGAMLEAEGTATITQTGKYYAVRPDSSPATTLAWGIMVHAIGRWKT